MTENPNVTSRIGRVNIINFIRGIEPRPGRNIDLIEPVVRQIELSKKYRLPVTWLVQYDAMIDPRFQEILQTIQPEDEIGVWLEFVQPLVEKAGLHWRGRYPWDWHVNFGFSVGYAPEDRLRMIDLFLEEFYARFGRIPTAAGSWLLDAASLVHLETRHKVTAFCTCKEQWGTDGYTLWGGYFNQAYYPSKQNYFIPAQTADQQINIPVFRMLGSDPIRQYEMPRGTGSCGGQGVITLESISSRGGGKPDWTDQFLSNIFETPSLSFGYTQVGQENSFGWPAMSKGLIHQHQRIAELRERGLVRVETLTDSGEWFRKTYAQTPPSAVVAQRDLGFPDRGATWYCSKNYRASLIWDGHTLRLRDIQLFDEDREEPFLKTICHESACKYDALPVMDSFLWSPPDSSDADKAGLRILDGGGEPLSLSKPPQVSELDRQTLHVQIDDRFAITFEEDSFTIQGPAGADWTLAASWSPSVATAFLGTETNRLRYRHEGYDYSVALLAGSAKPLANGFDLISDASGRIRLGFSLSAK